MSEIILADLNENQSKIEVTAKSFSGRNMVALIPGAKWKNGHWELPVTFAACKQLRYTFGEDIEFSDELIEWGWIEVNSRINPSLELRSSLGSDNPENYDKRLYSYQSAGADFLISAGNAILSDPPGAGKTAQAISAARRLNALPALVIAPKSTLISWSREIETWWPSCPSYVITGTKEKRESLLEESRKNPGFVILNWESVRLHSRLAPYGSMRLSDNERRDGTLNTIPFKLIIADEAHRMTNPKSKQTRAVWAIGDMTSIRNRWALTGTPLTNQIDTIWPILRFLCKEEHPSRVAFIDRYALTRPVPWGQGVEVIGLNPANEEEFQDIFQPRLRRMPKEVILPQLPPIQRVSRFIPMTDAQASLYNRMAEEMLAVTETGEFIIAANPAVRMMRMVQFSSSCADVMIGDDGELHTRLKDPSNKLDTLMDDLSDLLEAGESIVVFAVSRQLIEMAEDRLQKKKINYSVIKGDQTMAIRQLNIDNFQQGNSKVCLVVIAAGGIGITLTAARIGIFLQRSWSYVENNQAEGRLHRIGSERHEAIEIIDYISEGTADNTVVQVAEGKAVSLEEIVRDEEAIRRMLYGEE